MFVIQPLISRAAARATSPPASARTIQQLPALDPAQVPAGACRIADSVQVGAMARAMFGLVGRRLPFAVRADGASVRQRPENAHALLDGYRRTMVGEGPDRRGGLRPCGQAGEGRLRPAKAGTALDTIELQSLAINRQFTNSSGLRTCVCGDCLTAIACTPTVARLRAVQSRAGAPRPTWAACRLFAPAGRGWRPLRRQWSGGRPEPSQDLQRPWRDWHAGS